MSSSFSTSTIFPVSCSFFHQPPSDRFDAFLSQFISIFTSTVHSDHSDFQSSHGFSSSNVPHNLFISIFTRTLLKRKEVKVHYTTRTVLILFQFEIHRDKLNLKIMFRISHIAIATAIVSKVLIFILFHYRDKTKCYILPNTIMIRISPTSYTPQQSHLLFSPKLSYPKPNQHFHIPTIITRLLLVLAL